MKRQFDPSEPELMDRPQPVNEELRGALRNLNLLNRWFGGFRPVQAFVARHTRPGQVCRILDLACGYADIPRRLLDWGAASDRQLRIHAVDFSPATLAIARDASQEYEGLTFEQADGRDYETDQPYDLVLNTLTLHHFTESDAVRFLRAAKRCTSGTAYITDLRRSVIGYWGLFLLTGLILRNRMTRLDALASMRAAFSPDEFRGLASSAGWNGGDYSRLRHYRQAICYQRSS